ncbi:MAG TPA: RDD family protein, partial [Thermoanaerobaculia bacterium]|nr:RDD family protein [Thermoanaerobaculia bacterium]
MNENDYIDRVLALLPRATPLRAQIEMELRGHIAESIAQGHSLDEAVAQLGDPVRLAESYLSAVPLEPAPHLARIAAKLVDIGTVVGIAALPVLVAWFVVSPEVLPFVAGIAVLCGGIGFLIYTIVAEHRRGQTIGKRLTGLQVVTESGMPIGLGQS